MNVIETLQQIIEKLAEYDAMTGYAGQVFTIIFLALMLDFAQKRLLLRLQGKIDASQHLWDDALIHAIRRPLSYLIWLLGISFAAEVVGDKSGITLFQAAVPVRTVGIIALFIWFLTRLISAMEKNVLINAERQGKRVDITTVDAVSKLLRISVIITGILVGLQTLGFSVSGILAFGGVGGIAVGFAAKDLLANFFGGLMIYLDRPFDVGDWVRSPDRDIEGTIEKIGWRLTCIRTFDKRPLYVPNSTFTSIAVENPSRMSHRRINETIGIRYGDIGKMAAIVGEVKGMLMGHPDIDQTQTMIVNFNTFAASSLNFFIYTFTRTTNWIEYHEVKQDVLLKVAEIIERHHAEIAFPTTTVHVPESLLLQQRDEREAGRA